MSTGLQLFYFNLHESALQLANIQIYLPSIFSLIIPICVPFTCETPTFCHLVLINILSRFTQVYVITLRYVYVTLSRFTLYKLCGGWFSLNYQSSTVPEQVWGCFTPLYASSSCNNVNPPSRRGEERYVIATMPVPVQVHWRSEQCQHYLPTSNVLLNNFQCLKSNCNKRGRLKQSMISASGVNKIINLPLTGHN